LNRRTFIASSSVALAAAALPVFAQDFPTRAVTLVVALPAGGITDTLARALAHSMSATLGKPVVVENKPGGGGQIAANHVRQQPADGHTIFVAATEMFSINPSLYRSFSYDPLKDFTPITSLVTSPLVLVVPANSPVSSVSDLVQQSHARKNGLNFGSQGIGSIGHLLGELFRGKTNGQFTHIPYKGSTPALHDLMGGQVDFMFDPIISTAPLIAGKKLKVLAIAADKRAPQLPDVPTMAEQGVSGVDAGVWFGAVVKAGTPAPIVSRLHTAIAKGINDPAVMQRLTDQGMQPFLNSPEQFAAFIQSETVRWSQLVKASGASVD